jgi:3-oxoacyl-[acyl-carrier protein] reductase
MDLGLSGRGCVVTGASRGIGRHTARLLCEAGARVLLVARGRDDLDAAVADCAEFATGAGSANGLVLDVTADDAGERIAAATAGGEIDVLVNNAGTATWRDLDEVPDEDWYTAFELNVMAPKRLMDTLVPPMAERGWGRVVNVSSTAGKRPSAMMAEYSVAKAAQLSLSRLYADRFASRGVMINAICPGPTKSEMWMEEGGLLDQSRAQGDHDSREGALEAAGVKRPIGRLAEVAEVAAAVAFLCSEHSSYTSGAAWSVDGGTVQVII